MAVTEKSQIEIRANTFTAGDQNHSAIVGLAGGGYVIAWDSLNQDGNGYGVHSQLYDLAGIPVGTEQYVSSAVAPSIQWTLPSITETIGGGYSIAWTEYSSPGIYYLGGRDYDSSGMPAGDIPQGYVLSGGGVFSASYSAKSSYAMFPDGTHVVVYGNGEIFGTVDLPSSGKESFRANNTITGTQSNPDVSVLANDSFVVVWQSDSNQDGDGKGVYMQCYLYDTASNLWLWNGAETLVNTTTVGDQITPKVATLSNGNFVVAWDSNQNYIGTTSYGVYIQVFNGSGVRIGSETQITTYGISPEISALNGGGYVITYYAPDASGSQGIYEQLFDANGSKVGMTTLVNLTTADTQFAPQVASLSDGGYVISWNSNLQDGSAYGVYSQRFDPFGKKIVATLSGDASDDIVAWSGAGSVILDGGAGNDTLTGGIETEKLLGGDGVDTATYASAIGAVAIDLGISNYQNTGGAGNHRFVGIENLIGSDFDDSLTGDSADNVIEGGAGNDSLSGGSGNDTLYGGAGNDLFIVDTSGDQIVETSGQGTDSVQTGAGYKLDAYIENLTLLGANNTWGTGNGLNNVITGNDGNNTLNGSFGADTMSGGHGNDTYIVDNAKDKVIEGVTDGFDTVKTSLSVYTLGANLENLVFTTTQSHIGTGNSLDNNIAGSAGTDVLKGGLGNDTLKGGDGDDTLTGGAGTDAFVFNTTPNSASNVDTITDFNPVDDVIKLENSVFKGLGTATGTLASWKFCSGAGETAAHDANDRIIYDTSTGALYYDADGTGTASSAVEFAVLGTTAHPATITNTDFLVI